MQKALVMGLLTLILCTTGCLFGGHSSVNRDGTYVAASTIDQIQPGKTTKSWVHGVIGEPSEKIDVGPGHELWKYNYTETKKSNGYVFLIFSGSDKKVTQSSFFVEFDGDVVSRTWRG